MCFGILTLKGINKMQQNKVKRKSKEIIYAPRTKVKGKKKEEDSDDGSTNLTYNDELLLVEEHEHEHDIVLQYMSFLEEMFFALILHVNWIVQVSQQKRSFKLPHILHYTLYPQLFPQWSIMVGVQ
ncbi:hypothetical protein MTR_6g079400 [Medicago truncatula]|uniref:Uncharacterized protein n=1 Tax=Medicago truncatula TaxID=3880 RepID=A0A072UAW5_MEDTR|nr:hypothetical protein MTR_6g079400 [Medicago truncatula]